MSGCKVLVVDDEAAIRRLLRVALERAEYEVIEAGSGREALSSLDIDRPDAVLLDLGLPDREGLELIPMIVKTGAAVLVVSAREATLEKVSALDLGADDYVTKPFDTDEVLARVRRALRQRLSASGSETVRIGDLEIDLLARRIRRGGTDIQLTRKEYGLLAELAKHAGRVLTHGQLLNAVWGPAHAGHVDYLRVTARGLRTKIELDPSHPLIVKTEPGVGYRLADPSG